MKIYYGVKSLIVRPRTTHSSLMCDTRIRYFENLRAAKFCFKMSKNKKVVPSARESSLHQ